MQQGGEHMISGAMASVPAQSESVDDHTLRQMESLVHEAAERVTFHRIEEERWERVGRAAARALQELNRANPVAQATPESFVTGDEPEKAARF